MSVIVITLILDLNVSLILIILKKLIYRKAMQKFIINLYNKFKLKEKSLQGSCQKHRLLLRKTCRSPWFSSNLMNSRTFEIIRWIWIHFNWLSSFFHQAISYALILFDRFNNIYWLNLQFESLFQRNFVIS